MTAALTLHASPSQNGIMLLAFGQPAPQGSKRHVGNGRMIESSKNTAPWREAVKYAARLEIETRCDWQPLDGPLLVRMVFTFTRPTSHYRTGKNAHLLRANAPLRPTSPPDLSKLARSTEDALTDAGVWRDDARVCEYLRLAKVYVREDNESLAAPGVRIDISRLESS